MAAAETAPFRIALLVAPGFNMAATMAFLDPFRAANYLAGRPFYRWTALSAAGGAVPASNGLTLETRPLAEAEETPRLGMVSTSWTPEAHGGGAVAATLRRWARFGAALGGLDTGAFVLAAAGLLDGRRATVHYEHIDSFAELFPAVEVAEDLYVVDGDRLTCCGGAASADLALQIIRAAQGDAAANAAARYLFHDRLRPPGAPQNPEGVEPLGAHAPARLRAAIRAMERRLEDPAPIPALAAEAGLSQRQLERLFHRFVGRSPQHYYRDIRLDRARSLVTQTEMPVWEIGLACGFASPEHFSRAYRARFGVAPRVDRVEGRVPFEFRAWPMHSGRRGG
jgi:AraC family carnitine catabolism transcriptional activator